MHGEPTTVQFNEQYPHMVTAWLYDDKYLSDDFNYHDTEKEYLFDERHITEKEESIKSSLDKAHNKDNKL